MKLSLCNEVIRELDFPAQCDFAAKVGYDGLEVAPFTLAGDPHLLPKGERAAVRQAMADAGIACSSLHWLLLAPDGLSITDRDDAVRARTIDVMRRLIELAGDLGAAALVHGSPAQRRLEPGDEAGGRARAAECFAAIADDAKAAGVVYCLEPLAGPDANYLNSLEEAAEVVKQIGSPAVRTMIDCSATAVERGEPLGAVFDAWLPTGLVAHVQVNDANRRGPGEGDVPMAPVVASLRRNDYAGWVAVEPFVYEPDGPACAARAAGYMRALMEALP